MGCRSCLGVGDPDWGLRWGKQEKQWGEIELFEESKKVNRDH
jgi:hypothetical protein